MNIPHINETNNHEHELEGTERRVRVVSLLTALCLDAESVFEAFVRVGTGDNLGVGAAHVHISLPVDDVAAVALKPIGCRERRHRPQIWLVWN